MQNKNDYITMLGTGNALATRCYNTCFTLHGEKGVLLVDAGGGNGILTQLEKAGIRREDISDLFVTHAHTDHLLGCVDKWRSTSGRLLPTGRKKAKQGSWRISEATLLLLAVIGGSIGALLGMLVWHHKTMHLKFKYGLPLILLAQIALIYFINK